MASSLRKSICILACNTVQDNKPITIGPWSHVKSITMVAMAAAKLTTRNTYIADKGGVYEHHFAQGCYSNIIMLP